jgi:hypothetical protein
MDMFPSTASEVADIGITLTGMVFGATHLFFRANAERLAIRPKNMPWTPNRQFRLFGSSDLHDRTYISAPLLEPKLSQKSTPRQQSPVPNEPPPDYPDPINRSPVLLRNFEIGPPTPILTQYQSFERPLQPPPAQLPPAQTTSNGYTTEAHPGTPVMSPTHSWQGDEESIVDGYAEPSPIQPPAPLFAARLHERNESTATSGSIEIGLRLSRPFTGMDTSPSAPLGLSNENYASTDLEKNLPSTSNDESYIQSAIMTPPPAEKKAPVPRSPPRNVGIGALGQGPKGGLRAMIQHTQRTSPLANVMKLDSPSPQTVKGNPFSPPTSSPPFTSPLKSGSVKKSPQNLSPPAVNGLPHSPSPRDRSPGQTSPQPSAQHAPQPSPQPSNWTDSVYSRLGSPTEWPQWAAVPGDWPSGDQVDMPTSHERRWA